MKYETIVSIAIFTLCLNACKKQEITNEGLPPCLQAKIEAFKQESGAESIIKILKPGGPLYWFVDSYGDGVEDVVDENCTLICIADCECVGTFVQCDDTQLNFPLETIWKK